ncbi:GreA/GreB family elongation factor [Chloroflexota bacterium]
MDSVSQALTLGEAASHFLSDLSPEESGASQQEIYKFIRWFGRERLFATLTAAEIANYAEQLSLSATDYARKLELPRAFLAYAKKNGWTKTNLALHIKNKKGKVSPRFLPRRGSKETVPLTRQGYTELEAELTELQNKRPELIEEIRRAATTKDFRENVPFAAAREQKGHLEGRIMELEETLKSAVFIDEIQKDTLKIGIGDSVILYDLDSGEELRYTLVNPKEINVTTGKISSASPIGKAIMGKGQGEIVEVVAPAGKLRYQVKQVER